jgi:hypothetical protein
MALRLWSRGTHKAQQSERRERTLGMGLGSCEFAEAGSTQTEEINKIVPLILLTSWICHGGYDRPARPGACEINTWRSMFLTVCVVDWRRVKRALNLLLFFTLLLSVKFFISLFSRMTRHKNILKL